MKAYFFDLKDTHDWANSKGKGLVNLLIYVVSLHLQYKIPFHPFLSKVAYIAK